MEIETELRHDTDKIIVNVSGSLFEVREELLKMFPKTLLGSPTKRMKFYDPYRNQYFFDRHRIAFEAILFFYQSGGRINCPENVPKKVFEEEIKYFEIPENENSQTYKTLILGNKIDSENLHPCQRRLWELFEFPKSSTAAKWLAIWSQFIVVLSVTTSCLRTERYLQEFLAKQSKTNLTRSEVLIFTLQQSHSSNNLWFSLDFVCYGWFSLECAVRTFASPKKLSCFRTWVGIIDLLTIFFFYVLLTVKTAFPEAPRVTLNVLDIFCLVRVFKLLRYSENFQILVSTFISGASELRHLFVFAAVFVVLSSTAMHFMETGDNNSTFTSIPGAFWWSIVTITTIGYGDMVPITNGGKVVASFGALFGTLMIALPLFRFAGKLRSFLSSAEDRMAIQILKKTRHNQLTGNGSMNDSFNESGNKDLKI